MCRHGRPELALPLVKWVTLLGIRKGSFPPHGSNQQCRSRLQWISLNRAYLETGVELLPRGKRVHKNGLYVPVVTRFLGNGQVTPERKTPILPPDTIIPMYRPHCEHTGPHLSKACEVSVGNLTGSAWPGSPVRWAVYEVCCLMLLAPLALREATGGKGEGPSDPLEELEDPERFLNRPPGERKLRSFLKGLCEATWTLGKEGRWYANPIDTGYSLSQGGGDGRTRNVAIGMGM